MKYFLLLVILCSYFYEIQNIYSYANTQYRSKEYQSPGKASAIPTVKNTSHTKNDNTNHSKNNSSKQHTPTSTKTTKKLSPQAQPNLRKDETVNDYIKIGSNFC